MKRVKPIRAAGRAIELTAALAGAPPCIPDPTGLFWFSETTGDFTEAAEAAYFISPEPDPFDSAGPLIAVARVLGETCGGVVWSWIWTPEPLPDPPPEGATLASAPAVLEDGASLLIYPAPGYGAGDLSVTAECAGQSLGPILLTLLPAPGGGGGGAPCCPEPAAGQYQCSAIGDHAACLFPIVGTNLHSTMPTEWSVDYAGDDPGPIELVGLPLSGMLVGNNLDTGGYQTTLTVTAALSWTCEDGPHAQTLTWTLQFSYH